MPKSQKASKTSLAGTASGTSLARANNNGRRLDSPTTSKPASNDNRSIALKLDQYYTQLCVAKALYRVFKIYFDPSRFLMVEPSAGTGSFFRLLPKGSIGIDQDPKYPGIRTADFLTASLPTDRPIAFIGNPPFGKNASMAVWFFNHAASQGRVIAFIVPKSFKKASIENRLDPAFHLIHEEEVSKNAFLFQGKPFNVPAVFQIWERRDQPRALRPTATTHPDFEFTTPDRADFAIQRVGTKAGRVHHDFSMSPSSTYFIRAIRGDVEGRMRQIDFASVARNTAGNPSLAKAEIVALY